jgi:hypothetical protein
VLDAWQHLPASVLRAERNRRQHLSSVLSRNELARDYAYNRRLFMRVEQGWYQFNPQLAVRRKRREAEGESEVWVPLFEALNLPLVAEFARRETWRMIDEYAEQAGLSPCPLPVMMEREIAAEQAALKAQAAEIERREAARKARAPSRPQVQAATPPAWGTPQAKALEIERIRREIEARRRQEGNEPEDQSRR